MSKKQTITIMENDKKQLDNDGRELSDIDIVETALRGILTPTVADYSMFDILNALTVLARKKATETSNDYYNWIANDIVTINN